MKKFLAGLTIISLIASSLLITGCDLSSSTTSPTEGTESYISLSINPEVEFTATDNIINSVNPVNEDAEILLSDINLIGMSVEAGAALFVELATESGYIDSDSETNAVTIDAVTEDNEEVLENSIENEITEYLDEEDITCSINRENFEEYQAEATALGISVQKLRLIYRAIDINPELTVDELKDLKTSELVHLVKGQMKQYNFGVLKEDFFAAKAQIRENYANMFALQAEIAAMNEELTAFEGTEEAKLALQNIIEAKVASYNELKAAYDTEIEALRTEFQAQYQLAKQEFKQAKQSLKELRQNKGQNGSSYSENRQTVKEDCSQNIENLKQQYKNQNSQGKQNGAN